MIVSDFDDAEISRVRTKFNSRSASRISQSLNRSDLAPLRVRTRSLSHSTQMKNLRCVNKVFWTHGAAKRARGPDALGCPHSTLASGVSATTCQVGCVLCRLAIRTAVLTSFSGRAAAKFVSALFVLVVSHKLNSSLVG